MPDPYLTPCDTPINVAHKVRRYSRFTVASGLVPDVRGGFPRSGSMAMVVVVKRRDRISPAKPRWPVSINRRKRRSLTLKKPCSFT